jgi:hypothetical protein
LFVAKTEFASELAIETQSIVISSEYRLAPEHAHSEAVFDVQSTIEWLLDPKQPAPVVCPVDIRQCGELLTQQPQLVATLPTIVHAAQLDNTYLRTGFVAIGSSAGANLVVHTQLSNLLRTAVCFTFNSSSPSFMN